MISLWSRTAIRKRSPISRKKLDLPLTLGLLVDTSGSQRTVLGQERDASHSFLDHVLREDKDKAFLIHFDSEVELLQDLTSSRQKLEASLDDLGAPQFSQTRGGGGQGGGGGGGGGGGRGGRGGYGGAGTLLYDAVYLASNELMKKQQGRKALIVLTDGVDHGSKETLLSSIETAQRADTLVYSILFTGEEGGGGYGNRGGFGGPRMGGLGGGGMGGGGMGGGRRRTEESRPDGKKVLEQLSRETGGRFFEVTKKLTIDQIYTAIDEELRNQYSLGYALDKDTGHGLSQIAAHDAKNKDLAVQTREGFTRTARLMPRAASRKSSDVQCVRGRPNAFGDAYSQFNSPLDLIERLPDRREQLFPRRSGKVFRNAKHPTHAFHFGAQVEHRIGIIESLL